MKKRIPFNLFLLLFLLPSLISAQGPISNIITVSNKFLIDYPQEKVHLHFDKQYYAAGDTIWYKSYVITAANGLPTNLSTSLNLSLVNENDSVVFNKKIPLFFGLGAGMIALPFSMKKGKYVIYAYTPWMQNFEKDFFFKKVIAIGNSFVASSLKQGGRKSNGLAQLSFFPESGDLVADIRSKIAFKYVDVNGLGKSVKGEIVNSKGDIITSFESKHAGMGIFAITPKLGETYTAIIDEGGMVRRIALPTVKSEGYVLSVNNLDTTNLVIKIAISPQLVNEDEVILIAQSNGVIKYAAKMKPQQLITTLIPKAELPTGITQLTVFNSSLQALIERLVFVNHNDDIKITIQSNKSDYRKRERVSLTIQADLGSYSIAVTDQTLIPSKEEDEVSMLSNLLLSSDLKGYIEKPNYYFSDNPDAPKFLDYLMLTQGWRRFKWNEVMGGASKPLPYVAEKSLSISGKVLTNSGSPIANTNVKLFSNKGIVFSTDTLTNKEGVFRFDNISFIDSTLFILQAKNKNESKNVKIVIDPTYSPDFKNKIGVDRTDVVDMTNYLASTKERYQDSYFRYSKEKENLLKEVEIIGEKKKIGGVQHSANLNGAGNADHVITAEMLSLSMNLFEYLQKNVGGVTMVDDSIMLSRNQNSNIVIKSRKREDPKLQFYVDGMNVDQGYAANLPVEDIEVVEVLKDAALTTIYGSSGYGGIMLITTKRGTKNGPNKTPGVQSLMVKGFEATKEFYSPKYTPTITNSKSDLRSTIYWNPNLITDKDGKTTIDFFNSDGVGFYKVVVEGINADGKIGRKMFQYVVN